MEYTQYLDSVFLGIVVFFILILAEDMLGIKRTGRIVLAIVAAVAHHKFGYMVGPAIASVLAIFGLNQDRPEL